MDAELVLTQHGFLTVERMLEMLEAGVDPAIVVGRRVRWTYASTRRRNAEAKIVAEDLKRLHQQMGAAEVIVFRAPYLKDDAD